MRILLIGHGKMGRLVEHLASAHDGEIAAIVDDGAHLARGIADAGPIDVAIDFTEPRAVAGTVDALAAHRINVVIGTTGWEEDEPRLRVVAATAGIGVLAAANFSIGMTIFREIAEEAARKFRALDDVGAWLHEAHHAAKKDAPSGTAVMLKAAMVDAGYNRPIDVSSTRAGSIPGTHTIGFDAAAETVTLTHTVRDRAVFAHGALEAARWLVGRRGWFSVRDMIGS